MSTVVVPSPPLIWVGWSCRRCGHTGGLARTTIPLPVASLSAPVVRGLLDDLRTKLVKVHQRGQGCMACREDFVLARHLPQGKTLEGVL